MLFILKIAVPPILVAVMSLAVRLWGPTAGGLLLGLPWMTGPILFFLTVDKGTAYGVDACIGIQFGVLCLSAYLLAYGRVAAFAPWPVCLAAGVAVFAVMASLTQGLGWSLAVTAVLAAVGLVAVYLLLPPPASSVPLTVLPWWDIPVRMLATLALVTAIVLSADLLGPQLSGIIATFPVIVTVVGAFTHHQSGPDAVRRMLRSLTLSLLAFVAFFFVVGTTMPVVGLAVSFLVATAAALPVSAALLVLGRLGVLR
jgi:hypothetical protein